MPPADPQSVEAATAHQIQAEDLELDRRALGVEFPSDATEFFSIATEENIRNFARSYGDDNPLYCDPDYGPASRWEGQIAPAIMPGILNAALAGERPPREMRGGRYRGIHVFASAFSWEFFQPLRPGDQVFSFQCLESVEEKETEFAGRSVFRTQRTVKINQAASVVAVGRMVGAYTERQRAGKKGKQRAFEAASYGDADLAAIDDIYAQEQRRGREPRWWEDVEVGEQLPAMVKGPFTLTDIIAFHAGGYYLTDLRTSRLAYQNRQRKPGFYVNNSQGIPDVVQRAHWESEWAQATGNPVSIDYGAMREHWLHHYVTDWMGDDAWITGQRVELRKFSFLGDAQFITGAVAAKREAPHAVDIELRMTNQRQDLTAVATATVMLPTRNDGPPRLPEPAAEIQRTAQQMMERHHASATG